MTGFSVILQIIFNGIMLGIQYAMVAVGFTLFRGVLNVLNFSHGDVFALGAFVSLIIISIFGVLTLTGGTYIGVVVLIFLLSMVVLGVIGVILERLAVKPVSKGPVTMSLLATLGLGIAIREGIRLFYPRGGESKKFPELFHKLFENTKGAFEFSGVIFRYENILFLVIGIIVVFLLALFINKTKMGLAIRAVAQDPECALMMGVNKDFIIDITFFIGSALAALAAILYGLYYNTVVFDMGAMMGVIGLSSAVLGGLGNIYGAIIGGFIFSMTEALSAALIPRGSEFMDVIAFAVVIIFLIFRPSGILGEKVYERV